MNVDRCEAETHCWRCGCEKNLERCHIVPDSLGGEDAPSNIVLLCKRCHADGPNVSDPEIMWDWIKAYKIPYYETFWFCMGLKEYHFIYGKSVMSDLNDIVNAAKELKEIDAAKIVEASKEKMMNKFSVHFGQPYLNNATVAGLYRMMLKDFAEEWGVEFPVKPKEPYNKPTAWWFEELHKMP